MGSRVICFCYGVQVIILKLGRLPSRQDHRTRYVVLLRFSAPSTQSTVCHFWWWWRSSRINLLRWKWKKSLPFLVRKESLETNLRRLPNESPTLCICFSAINQQEFRFIFISILRQSRNPWILCCVWVCFVRFRSGCRMQFIWIFHFSFDFLPSFVRPHNANAYNAHVRVWAGLRTSSWL